MSDTPAQICHLVIPSPDMAAQAAFYRGVLGWTVEQDLPGPGYWFFRNAPGPGGALMRDAKPDEEGMSFFVEVADIDHALDQADELGGTIVMEKEHLGEGFGWHGQMQDPCGNLIGLQTPERATIDASLPAQISHLAIPASDIAKSATFYRELFGWQYQQDTPAEDYWAWQNPPGRGGGFDAAAKPNANGMHVFVEVPAIEALLAKVEDLGGTITQAKGHIGEGLGFDAHLLDPAGHKVCLHSAEQAQA